MQTSESINDLAKALSDMQGMMCPAKKDKKNTFYKSSFATLESIWEAIREPLNENGLSITQDAVTLESGISVVTRLMHNSGQWIEYGPMHIPVNKNDAHGVGSSISYAKRYALGAALGIVSEEDDDGNKAVKAAPKDQPKEVKKISPEQVSEIKKALDGRKNIEDRMLKWASVDKIENIPSTLYGPAIKSLQKIDASEEGDNA